MAVEMYLKLGAIAGSATNRDHKGWIPAISCNWGLARVRGRSTTGEASKALTKGNEIKMLKAIGMESPAMMSLCASGAITEQAEIAIVPAVGKREIQRKYIQITLDHVVVKSMNTAGHCEDSFLTEEVLLGFRKINFEYFLPVTSSPGKSEQDAARRGFECDFVAQQSSTN